jgi:hypothetical protein
MQATVCSESHRWRKLTIRDYTSIVQDIMERYQFPCLETLEIVIDGNYGADYRLRLDISGAPKLRRIVLDSLLANFLITSRLDAEKTNWNKITHLTWGKEEYAFISPERRREQELGFLHFLPSLVEYRAMGSRGAENPVRLPDTQILQVHRCSSSLDASFVGGPPSLAL